ncbi:hypothetical protein PACTADRAFT_48204 [Pachysolen tannophilus NRRL Y-2460]|uniref:Urea transport protein n=1 Tax=Pachysolen tannophilus NRRL Y-2460 TaxID=669874 RepID=A0A1E4U3F6_PACTA|nr:hypothetical protein PACTADRAFT_48204 [Pachysolen tannophilus NRRL Y-2460]
MGAGILTTYSQIANVAGIHGLLTYTITGAIPIFLFSFFGPMIRRRCPDGFVLTEWVYHRYGILTMLYLSGFTILTMFLFMVSELAAISLAIEAVTGVNTTASTVVECLVTTIYTAIGGFKVSFLTDTIQAAFVLLVAIIGTITYGTQIHIDRELYNETKPQMLEANKLGWQLLYILFVAIVTNDCFLSGFWLRTFAAKTDKDLFIATGIASIVAAIICTLVGLPGILGVWTGDLIIGDDNGENAFFILLAKMDNWTIGVLLLFFVAISTCTFDSLQSGMTSTISNDIFRNRIPLVYIRIIVCIIIVPCIIVALKVADDVLEIYLIADLVSSAIIPTIFLGLSDYFFFLTGWEVMTGGFGALLGVFIFGTVYYGDAKDGGKLLLIWNGMYDPEDWGAFGAFVIAPFASILIAFIVAAIRISGLYVYSRITGKPFTALDKPAKQIYVDDNFLGNEAGQVVVEEEEEEEEGDQLCQEHFSLANHESGSIKKDYES